MVTHTSFKHRIRRPFLIAYFYPSATRIRPRQTLFDNSTSSIGKVQAAAVLFSGRMKTESMHVSSQYDVV